MPSKCRNSALRKNGKLHEEYGRPLLHPVPTGLKAIIRYGCSDYSDPHTMFISALVQSTVETEEQPRYCSRILRNDLFQYIRRIYRGLSRSNGLPFQRKFPYLALFQ